MSASGAARGGALTVRSYGAKGDGVTLDTAAINAAIQAGKGGRVALTAGPLGAAVYLIDATNGIKLNQAGTTLELERGVTVQVATNAADSYMAVEVTAADCAITGGTFRGDVDTHTGTTGEWGHLIVAQAGAHRLRVVGVTVANAWGDGIAIQNGPADVSLLDVTADSNRRQGCSIISAIRPRVIGGVYKNTGAIKATAPTAGIDIEPNASSSVTDALLSGVLLAGNKGPNLQIASATGSTVSATVTGCRAIGSTGATAPGFYVVGPPDTIKAKLIGCTAVGNTWNGFQANTNRVELIACTAEANAKYGFQINGADCLLTGCTATENSGHGIQIGAVANTRLVGGVTRANGQGTPSGNLDVSGTSATIIGHVMDAGALATKTNYGALLRAGATVRMLNCETAGAHASATINDATAGGAVLMPVPGAARQTLAAAAIDATTTQTLANSLRSALIALGYGA